MDQPIYTSKSIVNVVAEVQTFIRNIYCNSYILYSSRTFFSQLHANYM